MVAKVTYEKDEVKVPDVVEEVAVQIPDPEDAFLDTLSTDQIKVWSKLSFNPNALDAFVMLNAPEEQAPPDAGCEHDWVDLGGQSECRNCKATK